MRFKCLHGRGDSPSPEDAFPLLNDLFSMNAKYIKIITVNGVVTLRGPVDSVDEKINIVARIKQMPSVVKVDDQLEVKNYSR